MRNENAYLRKLVDNLLIAHGVTPVEKKEIVLPDDPEEIRRREIEARGGIVCGEG